MEVRTFSARDGVRLAYRDVGDGWPLVLVHGFFSTAEIAWQSHGHTEPLLAAGFRLLMADLRGHGDSARPHDEESYPPDALPQDVLDLVAHLGLADGAWDLAGYSLGGRVVTQALALGARPRRAVAGGVGLIDVADVLSGGEIFRRVLAAPGTFHPDSPERKAEDFLDSIGADRRALGLALDSQRDTTEAALHTIDVPTLLVMGHDDDPEGARELAAILPDATVRLVPGHHIGVGRSRALHEAIIEFLTLTPAGP